MVLGSRVTVVDRNDALAHREDRDDSEALWGLFDDDRMSVNDNLPPNGHRTTVNTRQSGGIVSATPMKIRRPIMNNQQLHESGQGGGAGIVEQIESQINRRLGGRVNDLRVIVQGEGLVLQGRARTYHDKQLALQAAMEITGRPILANEIRV